jgi:hypothetical protein
MRIYIGIIFIAFACSGIKKNMTNQVRYKFHGQVCVNVKSAFSLNNDNLLPLRAELSLMNRDSTILYKSLTDSVGYFEFDISIDTSWNPLLIMIKGQENYFLDTVISGKQHSIDLLCGNKNSVVVQPITINSNQKRLIKIDCLSLERDITTPKY